MATTGRADAGRHRNLLLVIENLHDILVGSDGPLSHKLLVDRDGSHDRGAPGLEALHQGFLVIRFDIFGVEIYVLDFCVYTRRDNVMPELVIIDRTPMARPIKPNKTVNARLGLPAPPMN